MERSQSCQGRRLCAGSPIVHPRYCTYWMLIITKVLVIRYLQIGLYGPQGPFETRLQAQDQASRVQYHRFLIRRSRCQSFRSSQVRILCLSNRYPKRDRHLLSVSAFPPTTPSLVTSSSLPFNPSIDSISQGLATAHRMYGLSRHSSHLPLCILFIVQDPENNVFDQHALAATLSGKHNVLSFRLPFGAATTHTSIPHDQSSRPLIYKPPHSPNTPYEVTTLYFRAGYSPSEYTSSKSWDARLHLERSAAIKCPSILTHLAGSKKVQQILATPSSPHLERFLSSSQISAEYIDRIRATFAAIYPLDDSSAGRHAISIATDPEKSRGYVLKPQREGGGNNVYGTKIPIFIRSLGDDSKKYRGHILMELIEPPTLRNSIFRNGQVMSGEVIGELGVYGLCLWHHGKEHTGSNILENWEAGYLLRTKGRDSEEGGVAAGFGAVDSVCLVDV